MADKPEIDGATLDRLFAVIASRVGADPALSYTAQLLRAGTAQIAKKFGEEAIETMIEGMKGDLARLVAVGQFPARPDPSRLQPGRGLPAGL